MRPIDSSKILFLMLFLAFLTATIIGAHGLTGEVHDDSGHPIENSTVIISLDGRELGRTFTDSEGGFDLTIDANNVLMTVYGDLEETDGVDYVPFRKEVQVDENISIVLSAASSILVKGNIQFVDTENLALQEYYYVLDVDNQTLSPSGHPLIYDAAPWTLDRLRPPDRHIIVPADSQVRILVNSSFLYTSQVMTKNFSSAIITTAPKGEVIEIDVREYTLPLNFEITEKSRAQLHVALDEMLSYGFYVTRQKSAQSSANRLLSESKTLYEDSNYPESFDSLKRSYISLTHASRELEQMFKDANLSVFILIVFFAFASLTTGYLLGERTSLQMTISTLIYALSLSFFYLTYPGSKTISLTDFAVSAVASIIGFTFLGLFTPKLFSVGSIDGRIHTRNLLIPILGIAKRSLRRRRLRFMLTLLSITLLVMSFVTLTSFSEGYGLIERSYPQRTEWTGAFIREGSWLQIQPTFIQLSEAESDWLISQPEVAQLSPKAENTPQRKPILMIQIEPIYGIIGLGPEEDNTVGIRRILLNGVLPDDDGVLISGDLANQLNLALGDILYLGFRDLAIQGFFNEEALRTLKDLDGSPYMPNKMVNTNPAGEVPNWVLGSCEPREVIFMTTTTTTRMPYVGIQRISLQLTPDSEERAFAERLALERGYKSYASTADGYYAITLGNFFEGRGFSLAIPWAIVVLNVVVTMLNALFERRKEIEILSSVGLNPAQVSSIFVAEATVTGFIAGGLGYLLGLGIYKGMAVLNLGLQVHQKVSAFWSLASIALAITAVLTGAMAALRNSVVITPSLQRKWSIDRSKGGFQEPWTVTIPLKLLPEEVENYIDHILKNLESLRNHPVNVTSSIKRRRDGDVRTLQFIYKSFQTTTGNFYTKNELIVKPLPNGEYGAELKCLGDLGWVHVVGSLVRQYTLDYSAVRGD
ncbi:MAG: hypothetical protein NWE89_00295 [Candidatus Bathyarchaeota archaeon]|nr:hypothetical protein [Candidatus Bathyarchaeota archaeon]